MNRMNRSWLVGRYWVNWFVNRFRGWAISCVSFVNNLSNITRICIGCVVGNNLGASVRKQHTVLTRCGISISLLILSKIYTTVVILNGILVSIYWWSIGINWSFSVSWSWVVRSWRASFKYSGKKGRKCNESLKEVLI